MTRTVIVTRDKHRTACIFLWSSKVVLDYNELHGYHVRKGYRAGPIVGITIQEFERIFGWRPERRSKHKMALNVKIKS